MFIINQKAGEAARQRGFARFPEDFEKLGRGTNSAFIWWRDGENIKIETTLNGENLQKELSQLRREMDA